MGHPPLKPLAVAALTVALLSQAGCVAIGQMKRALREPGEQLIALPDDVAGKYECESRRLPYFVLERNEINPPRLEAGAEFNHRLVYALCPSEPTAVVVGTLRTRIRYQGRVIVDDQGQRFEIKPGRWAVDAFVRLPDDASPGIYAVEVAFEGPRIAFRESATFGIEPSKP